jgi:hypothetical protein
MLYDYDLKDITEDQFFVDAAGYMAFGFANAHYDTVLLAQNYLLNVYGTRPDPRYPQWQGPAANIPTFLGRPYYEAYARSDAGNIAIAALVTRWLTDAYTSNTTDPKQVARYASLHNANNLSDQDMAIIFSAYRAGVADWSPPASSPGFASLGDFQRALAPRGQGLGCNAKLALPVMEFMKTMFPSYVF